MLVQQQALALVVDARKLIVQGAVDITTTPVTQLEEMMSIVELRCPMP